MQAWPMPATRRPHRPTQAMVKATVQAAKPTCVCDSAVCLHHGAALDRHCGGRWRAGQGEGRRSASTLAPDPKRRA